MTWICALIFLAHPLQILFPVASEEATEEDEDNEEEDVIVIPAE